MQKPTIEKIDLKFEDNDFHYLLIKDIKGIEHKYWLYDRAEKFYQSELAKWQAEQEPTVLFESETVKVMKFNGQEQFFQWENKLNHFAKYSRQDFDCSTPIFIEKKENYHYAICNITDDLIQAVQSVNVATVKHYVDGQCLGCGECENPIDVEDNFCPNCGKTIKEVE